MLNVPITSDTEHGALTHGAGLVDLTERTRIELTGDDRASFLHNLSTNGIKGLAVGSGCEAFLLNARGHVLGHVFVICRPESLVLETVPGQEEFLLSHLDRYLIREKVELHPRTADWGELLLAGPQAAELLSSLLGAPPPAERLCNLEIQWQGQPLTVVRVEMTQPGGYLVLCAQGAASAVADALVANGAERCSSTAYDAARIEAGFPWYGRDITDKTLPQEVARDQLAISFKKGCYIGQETVARIDALGHVNKSLVGVRFEGTEVPSAGAELRSSGDMVGQITSAAFSLRLRLVLGLAYVRRGLDRAGVKLDSAFGAAEVVALPLA